ncbi:hypothetical protein CW751_01990 [Brumimicrobium salinarum]|uniref:Lycopene cyclase domain-containing protein n=2 Tax=Brumimicrobium salinarum TaxID=2058658 RepID=A0A2I0R6C1_9FLAO|nr:hypothetical protein CW751_01990 [Brumimicrobium salinarum]
MWINVLIILFLLLLSFEKKIRFYTYWKTLFPALLGVGSVFVALVIYFTDVGVWSYSQTGLTGYSLYNVPVEGYLLLFTIPYAGVFIYEAVKIYSSSYRPVRLSYYFALLFTLFAIVTAVMYKDNVFTFTTFLGAGLLNWIVYFGFTPRWYPYFCISFFSVQIPLLIVNGIFMRIGKNISILHFNENKILEMKIFYTPLELICFNFLLLFSVIIIHEYFRNLWENKQKST